MLYEAATGAQPASLPMTATFRILHGVFRRCTMRSVGEERGSSTLTRLVSVPGLVVFAILGVAVIILARAFGPENFLREVITEVIASIGSTILVLAVFGLLFRTGIERLLRGAPGGGAFADSVERLQELLRELGDQDFAGRGDGYDAELERLSRDVRTLVDDELPALRNEMAELRRLLASSERERGN